MAETPERKPGQLWQMWKEGDASTYMLIKRFEKTDNNQAYWEVLHQGEVHVWREGILSSDVFVQDTNE